MLKLTRRCGKLPHLRQKFVRVRQRNTCYGLGLRAEVIREPNDTASVDDVRSGSQVPHAGPGKRERLTQGPADNQVGVLGKQFHRGGLGVAYAGSMTWHVFESFALNAGMCLHMVLRSGRDPHHIVEAQFKALARALREAVELDPRQHGIPSTKGVLA